jgi:hypothetical protein
MQQRDARSIDWVALSLAVAGLSGKPMMEAVFNHQTNIPGRG